jgi:hypothetical protein
LPVVLLVLTAGIYLWPGQIALAAVALEVASAGMVGWPIATLAGLLLAGLLLGRAPRLYGLVQVILCLLLGLLMLGATAIAVLVGSPAEWGGAALGLLGLADWLGRPGNAQVTSTTTVLLGALAFCGRPGFELLWHSLFLRDVGAGMAQYGEGDRGGFEPARLASAGGIFDSSRPANWNAWLRWRRWCWFEAALLVGGVGVLSSVVFSVLALAAGRLEQQDSNLLAGPAGALFGQLARPFAELLGRAGLPVFTLMVVLAGWWSGFGTLDAVARSQAEIARGLAPVVRGWPLASVYRGFLGLALLANLAVVVLNWDRPGLSMLDTLALFSAAGVGVSSLVVLLANNLCLPLALRPPRAVSLLLGAGTAIYLLGLIWCLLSGAWMR